MITGIDVILYSVKDFARALAFYTALVGHAPATLIDGMWAEFELADGTTFGIGKDDSFAWQQGYLVMFAVPDVPAAVDLVRSLGGTVRDPDESPVCYMAFGEDTEGNRIVLHKRKT
jgi:predicted enzyme related to lactoylglutathione lyase